MGVEIGYHCLQYKRQFARSGHLSEFHIFAPPDADPCTVPPPLSDKNAKTAA